MSEIDDRLGDVIVGICIVVIFSSVLILAICG